MKTKKSSEIVKQEQVIQLMKGEFTPSQASEIVLSLINQKINYHKVERIQLWESDHKCDQVPINTRIEELEQEKIIAADFIKRMSIEGKKLKINGSINMTSCEQ